ncbi:MAG: hypothetical protein SFY81_00885, partial [Verrucomicrobiota bacterium]|nr:hypothetical protein [Verrucomicrobiota bacterium]
FAYNGLGRLVTEDGPWVSDVVSNLFNASGLRSGMVVYQPTGTFTNGYLYDAGKRLTNLTSKAGTFSYDYFPPVGGVKSASRLVGKVTLAKSPLHSGCLWCGTFFWRRGIQERAS